MRMTTNTTAVRRLIERPVEPRKAKTLVIALAGLLASAAAFADPGYYLVTVYENEGEANLNFRYWTVKFPRAAEVIWPEIGVGYGVTKRWHTELLGSYIGSSGMATRFSSLNWQNDFLLTQGQYDFDLALHTNLIRNHGRPGSSALEFGPVLQTELGRMQINANLIFERNFDSVASTPTQLKYQWQAKYRWKPEFQFGLQGFGELGDWNHWAPRKQQSHRAGPMISGTVPVGATDAIKYQVALLSGSIYGTGGRMFSMRLQYVF